MKIYTRAGDKGRTQIIGHKVVPKNDARVESYGSIDELNSWVGYTISILTNKTNELHDELEEIQQILFDIGRDLATLNTDDKHEFIFTDEENQRQTKWLEEKIDKYTEAVPQTKRFVLPGGSIEASALHFARTITRRVERTIVDLQQEDSINENTLIFVNRLSDYFFAAARYANLLNDVADINYRNGRPVFR